MKLIFSILILLGITGEPTRRTPEDDISPEAVQFLKDHDAYDDVIDAFYSEEL